MKNVVAVFLLVCFDRVVIALFCLFVGLAFSTFSHAGYYATITANSSAYCGLPATGGCYLTLSSAIVSTCPAIVKQIESIDSSSKTWSSTYSGHSAHDASGTYSQCSDAAASPVLAVGVVDPSITSGGGSGGSSSPDVSALQSTVTALQGQLAAVSAANVQNSSDLSRVNTALSEPYDYGTGGLIFSAMLISTLSLYLLTRGLMMFVAAVNAARRL